MAKENTVILFGMIDQPPAIKTDPETGEYRTGKIILMTLRRSYMNEDTSMGGAVRVDTPCVFSKNKYVIKHNMADLQRGDLVVVKGTLSTLEGAKRFICPCGEQKIVEGGVIVYVDPLTIVRVEKAEQPPDGLSSEEEEEFWKKREKEAFAKLRLHDEIGNVVTVMGFVCVEPDYYEAGEQGKKECQFKLAVNRSRRIPEDGPDRKTDYPVVKAYGPKAEEYYNALEVSSHIYVKGAIQTREITRHFCCDKCKREFERPGGATEIVVYDIEYIRNCNIPEPKEAEERQ